MHLKEVKFKLFIILMIMFYDIAFNENKEIIKSLISLNFFQGKSGVCHTCRFPSFRLHACLYCVYFGCYTTKHIHEHAFSKNHNLGTSLSLSLIIICWNLINIIVFIMNGVLLYSIHSC